MKNKGKQYEEVEERMWDGMSETKPTKFRRIKKQGAEKQETIEEILDRIGDDPGTPDNPSWFGGGNFFDSWILFDERFNFCEKFMWFFFEWLTIRQVPYVVTIHELSVLFGMSKEKIREMIRTLVKEEIIKKTRYNRDRTGLSDEDTGEVVGILVLSPLSLASERKQYE